MDWFKVPVNLRRDPVLRQLSAKAWDGYLAAVADSAEFETDGKYVCAGKMSAVVKELLEAGALVQIAEDQYELYRWPDLMPSKAELEQKRGEARTRMAIVRDDDLRQEIRARDNDHCRYCTRKVSWNDRRSAAGATYDHVIPGGPNTIENLVTACRGCNSSKGSRTPEEAGMVVLDAVGSKNGLRTRKSVPTSNSLSTSVVNGSQEPTSGHRDLAYEALGDCWQGDWHGLPNDARGRINEALGSLRNMSENRERDDDALAAEIRARWAKAETWKSDWQWTPQTFLRYWRKLAGVKAPAAVGEGDPATFVGTPEWNAARDAEYARTVGLG